MTCKNTIGIMELIMSCAYHQSDDEVISAWIYSRQVIIPIQRNAWMRVGIFLRGIKGGGEVD